MAKPVEQAVPLKRALSLPLVTFYGLGTILGAGIYVLIGEVAAQAGMQTPLAFLLAAALATFSALSYAELSARYPVSAGEAVYLFHAFDRVALARLIGILLVAIGAISGATMINGFVGYFQVFFPLPPWLIITLLTLALGAVAAWGISESAWLAALTTVVEIGGLLIILWVGHDALLEQLPHQLPTLLGDSTELTWVGLFSGAFIAFYAFVGFEDIVNVAEEVKEPQRNVPRAIILSLVVTTLLYLAVAATAVLSVPLERLAGHEAPLAMIYQERTGQPPHFITLISLAAIINGALIQIVMVSRVLYGMGNRGWIPRWFSEVHPRTQTPLRTTAAMTLLILTMALWLPLVTLAELTSLITLLVFTLINVALWRLKHKEESPTGVISVPLWIPAGGAVVSLAFVLFQLSRWLLP